MKHNGNLSESHPIMVSIEENLLSVIIISRQKKYLQISFIHSKNTWLTISYRPSCQPPHNSGEKKISHPAVAAVTKAARDWLSATDEDQVS